jgi:hypothetical protein
MSKQSDWTANKGSPKSLSAVEGRRLICIENLCKTSMLSYTDYTDWGHTDMT